MTQSGAIMGHPQPWPVHNPWLTKADFLLMRHLRVARARSMRLLRGRIGGLTPARNRYGVTMWPDWSDKTFAYCHYGTYGRYLSDLLASIDRPFCFLDIGANQGLFSLVAGKNPHCRSIVALEPVQRTHDKLAANLTLNDLDPKASRIRAALSDRDGECQITLRDAHSGMATLGSHLSDVRDCRHSETVRLITMRTLDEYLPSDLPIFAKIDVEGHEPVVLQQLLRSSHRSNILAMFYEMDERWADAGAVAAMLADAGFETSRKYGRGVHYDVLATRNDAAGGLADIGDQELLYAVPAE